MGQEERKPSKRIFDNSNPKAVWAILLGRAAERELAVTLVEERSCVLASEQERAINLRKWSLVTVNAIDILNRGADEDEESVSSATRLEAQRDFRMGMSRLTAANKISPLPVFAADQPLDTPLKLAEYVAGQILETWDEISVSIDESAVIRPARHYLFADFDAKEEPEFDLEKAVVWDESQKLWEGLSAIILNDPELVEQMPEDYLRLITQEDVELDLSVEAMKTFVKKNGKGEFRVLIDSNGICIEERDERGEFLGSALVLGPGNTDGYISFTEDDYDNDHVNTDVALREVKRIVSAFLANLS